MADTQTDTQNQAHPLRLLPGIIAVSLQWLGWYFIPMVAPEFIPFGMMGGLLCWLAVIIWWVFFSHAPKSERWMPPLLMIASLIVTAFLLHKSIATAMMGFMFPVFATPFLSLAFITWAVISHRLSAPVRRISMIGAIVLTSGFWTLLRTGGFTIESSHDLAWRWSPTPEELLLSQTGGTVNTTSSRVEQMSGPSWPGLASEGPIAPALFAEHR